MSARRYNCRRSHPNVSTPEGSSVAHFLPKRQLFRQGFRQRDSFGEPISGTCIGAEIFAHDNTEPPFAVHDNSVLLFVLSLREIRQIQLNRLSALFDLAPNPVNPPCALFEVTGIPAEIVMDDITTEPVQIDAFRHYAAGDQELRKNGLLMVIVTPISHWDIFQIARRPFVKSLHSQCAVNR